MVYLLYHFIAIAPLAQLVEQLTLNQWVRSSSLRRCTIVGVTIAQGPPVPIPNTEVKLCGAEDTCLATDRENRSTPTSFLLKNDGLSVRARFW